jgi:hypothetical protein
VCKTQAGGGGGNYELKFTIYEFEERGGGGWAKIGEMVIFRRSKA